MRSAIADAGNQTHALKLLRRCDLVLLPDGTGGTVYIIFRPDIGLSEFMPEGAVLQETNEDNPFSGFVVYEALGKPRDLRASIEQALANARFNQMVMTK